ncbi:MAG: hypothetical protein ACXADL_11535 [Candidatus Thorarchaeota archaeon]|jgi:hypothetical protein
MTSDQISRQKIIGVVAAISLFIIWIFVDLLLFPQIGIDLNYPLYEIVAYGSWFIIILVILVILSWAGAIPTRYRDTKSPTNSE